MRLAIIIPTTDKPVRIDRISRLSRAPLSQVITAEDFVPSATMTARYSALIDQAGPLRDLLKLGDARFELCLDRLPEMGRSWELPVAIAHWAIDHGHELVTADADLAVWATGVVRPDREIAEEDYHLDQKLVSSRVLLEEFGADVRRLVLLPGNAEDAQLAAFQAALVTASVKRIGDVDAAIASLASFIDQSEPITPGTRSTGVKARKPDHKRSGLVVGATVATLAIAAGAVFLFMAPAGAPNASVASGSIEDISSTAAAPIAPAPEQPQETARIDASSEAEPELTDPDPGEAAGTLSAATDGEATSQPIAAVETPEVAAPLLPQPSSASADEAASVDSTGGAEPGDATAGDHTPQAPAASESGSEPRGIAMDAAPSADTAEPAAAVNPAAATEVANIKSASPLPANDKPAASDAISSIRIIEHRAPPGHTCSEVLFGSASEVRVERLPLEGVFPSSALAGLCGISFEPSDGRTNTRLTLPGTLLAEIISSDRVNPIILDGPNSRQLHFVRKVSPLSYQFKLTDSGGGVQTFSHNLVGP